MRGWRWWLAVFLLAAVPVVPLRSPLAQGAPTVTQADQDAIRAVIERQIAAFRRDDGAAAFALATPGIKAMFGSVENFMTMVKNGYQPVYHPKEYSFGALADEEGRITQKLRVVGPDGIPRLALYVMERQPNGDWLIAGCVLLDLNEQSA